jgi:hypothetical protein
MEAGTVYKLATVAVVSSLDDCGHILGAGSAGLVYSSRRQSSSQQRDGSHYGRKNVTIIHRSARLPMVNGEL